MTLEHIEIIREAYADVELDEPTEAEWDQHTLAGLEDLEDIDRDRFAATPECENSK